MKVVQTAIRQGDATDFTALAAIEPNLVLAFGSVDALRQSAAAIADAFPGAQRAGCSTAGEITAKGVEDGTLVVTALHFDHTRMAQVSTVLAGMDDSFAAGKRLASGLPVAGLRAILIFGQGVQINGSAVLSGMTEIVGAKVPITGGLAGDGGAFAQTWVLDEGGVSSDRLICVGLYGDVL